MPVPMNVSIDGGTPQSVTAAATVLLQGTNSSSKPVRLKRIQLQSSNTGSTQQIVTVSYGFYATGTAGGTTVTGLPVDEGLIGVYTGSTIFKALTTTLGTTFTNHFSWQWNTANPFDILDGLLELQTEIPSSKVWAIILPTAPTAFSLTGTVNYEEFG